MNRKPEHILYRWLRSMKIPVSKMFLKQQLLSHPDYPSLLSITDTLDELNIHCGKRWIGKIPIPFLAHIYTKA
jgi:hypothetical protein